jgi:hypothetical protein
LAGVPRHLVQPLSPREQACAFLDDFLCEGPLTTREIWPEALCRGLSERTLERAKRELAIRSVRVWANAQHLSYWLLPGHDLPPDVEHFVMDPQYWLAKGHPPPMPIDDLSLRGVNSSHKNFKFFIDIAQAKRRE